MRFKHRSATALWVALGFCLLCLGTISCRQTQETTTSTEPAIRQDEGHGLHGVHDEQLRRVMEELRSLQLDQLAGEPGYDTQTGRDPAAVARMAEKLARDARLIPNVFRNEGMNAESRRVFDELASRMEQECADLKRLADRNDTGGMRSQVKRIVSTCNACHASFRGPIMAMAGRAEWGR